MPATLEDKLQPASRVSALARTAGWAGIIAALGMALGLLVKDPAFMAAWFLSILAAIGGIIALFQISAARGKLSGAGHAWVAIALAIFLTLAFGLLAPGIHDTSYDRNAMACGANLSGIVKAMNLYGAEFDDAYPTVPFTPYSAAVNYPAGVPIDVNPDATIHSLYLTSSVATRGSAPACMWIMVLKGEVSPKEFICKSDPFGPIPSVQTDGSAHYFNNFGGGSVREPFSYSFAYPWYSNGVLGPWWHNNIDASCPLAADMAPLQSTGSPAVDVTATGKIANTRNHKGEGQNVAYGDAHVTFEKQTHVGQEGDNIYSYRSLIDPPAAPGTPPTQTGGPFLPAPSGVTTTTPAATGAFLPWDITMVPLRNETTGGL